MTGAARGIVVYILVTFGLAWTVWGVPLLLAVPPSSTLMRALMLPGTFAPAIAAVIARKWVSREGFADAGLNPRLRNWPLYVVGWIVSITIVAFVSVAAPFFGLAEPQLGRNLTVNVAELSILAIISTPILWGEEFGWRSYLQLRLFPNSPTFAAIATGLIWGVWHYPLLLAAPEIPQHRLLTLALFPVGTVLYSFVFGWLRNRSGSIWPSSLAHSCINNVRSPLIATLFVSTSDKLPLVLLGFIPLLVLVLVGLLVRGSRAHSTIT